MKKLTYSVLLLTLIVSCKSTPDVIPPDNISLVIGNPISYGLDSVLLFPVGGNYNPKITGDKLKEEDQDQNTNGKMPDAELSSYFKQNDANKKWDRHAQDEFINTREEDFDIRNLLFYHKVTGSTYPLTRDTLHILSFAIHNEYVKPMIFFRIVKKDINDDRKYNSKDAVMLFISDQNGRNLVQVTPENEQFFDYFYYPETKTILVKTAIDVDNDKAFTSRDETNFREVKLEAPAFGREIFTQGLKDSLRILMQ